MQWPMQSFGERRMQPSTPCSASVECGGNRSTLDGSARVALRRRAFLKSAVVLPGCSSTESITADTRQELRRDGNADFLAKSSHAVHKPGRASDGGQRKPGGIILGSSASRLRWESAVRCRFPRRRSGGDELEVGEFLELLALDEGEGLGAFLRMGEE